MHVVKEVAPVVAESLLTSTSTNFSNIPATIDIQPASSQLQKAGLGFVPNESKEQQGSGSLLVWVDGQARSGTTLMRVLLDAHPDINCDQNTQPRDKHFPQHDQFHTHRNGSKVSYSKLDSYSYSNTYISTHVILILHNLFDFI